jgi:DNA-binding CsgD family transcriptional regulator
MSVWNSGCVRGTAYARKGGTVLGARDTKAVLDTAYELASLNDRDALVEVAADRLSTLVGGDLVGFDQLDIGPEATTVTVTFPKEPSQPIAWEPDQLVDHPVVRHFQETLDPAACRVSDVATTKQWKSSAAYNEFFRPLGQEHLLAIPVEIDGTRGAGYTVSRGGSDFSDRELLLVTALQAALAVQHHRHDTRPHDAGPLTGRERQIMALIAAGWTAAAVASRTGIATSTVRKHLQNIYAKLEVSDRLTAVNVLRAKGWL